MAKSNSESAAPLIRQFSKQIAGHAVVKGSSKPGMMKHEDGSLLKPILPPPRGLRELNFYKTVYEEHCQTEEIIRLRPLLPLFRGVFTEKSDKNLSEKIDFLKLEDVTERFIKPCILDVKMGAKTYDPEASDAKVLRENSKYKGTKVFGFCIPGMRVYDLKKQIYICRGKEYGKSLNRSNIKEAFLSYLNCETAFCAPIIESFIIRLREVSDWFSIQNKYHLFASSLLFVYEADSILSSSSNQSNSVLHSHHQNSTLAQSTDHASSHSFSQEDLKKLTELKMIDFAHVFDSTEKDENYILGLNRLIALFEEILTESKSMERQLKN